VKPRLWARCKNFVSPFPAGLFGGWGKKLTFLASLIIQAGGRRAEWGGRRRWKVVINYRNGIKLNWANIQVNYQSQVNKVRQERKKKRRGCEIKSGKLT